MENTGRKIIIVTGPESTGKTTIAEALAKKQGSVLYPEYARGYIESLNRKYCYGDIAHIANFQYKQFKMCTEKNELCILDTYLVITKIWFIWHEKLYPEWIDGAIMETRDALYLLCAPDIEWKPDPVRENGGDARNLLFEQYKNELEKFHLNYKIVTGTDNLRIRNAEFFVDSYLYSK